ncbi:MAG: 30S ribosomal protein S6 [Clostridia bacterium]|nr:30S ribosomal protein S6 [Clostridiales bacterium]MBR2614710.1 30S ribosomal protein S6 [Clostridia bacterium]
MTKYEMLYILAPEVEDEAKEVIIKKIEELVASNGAVEKTDKWGMKKLQYPINYKTEGFYVLMTFEAEPTFIKELQRVAGITDGIMRTLITKR